MEYPVIWYLVELQSNKSEVDVLNVTNITAATQVSIVLPDLVDLDQLYQYRVIAVNKIGNVSSRSDKYYFCEFIIVYINTMYYPIILCN